MLPEEVADQCLSSTRVIECFDASAKEAGRHPKSPTCDNGLEFISINKDDLAAERHVELDFITPGTPTANGYIESLHARQMEECLEMNSFRALEEASLIVAE